MQQTIRPTALFIDANASCQLRCPTCPTTGNGYPPEVGSGYLKAENLRKLLKENPQIRRIEFENRGEMFLNPNFLELLKLADEMKVEMACNSGTNLNTVGKGVLEGLVKYKFRALLCSIDGASQEVYQQYRRGGDFNRVIEHIKEINRYKKAYRSPYPALRWQFVVFGHNEHELPIARQMAKELDMEFVPKMSWDSKHSPIRDKEMVMRETGWTAVTREEFQASTGKNYMRNVCHSLWNHPHINWNGKILGCCWNSWGDFGSNAFEHGFIPAVNNEKINYARNMLLGKEAPRKDIPCTSCDLYRVMQHTGRFLTEKEVQHKFTWYYNLARWIYKKVPGMVALRRLLKR